VERVGEDVACGRTQAASPFDAIGARGRCDTGRGTSGAAAGGDTSREALRPSRRGALRRFEAPGRPLVASNRPAEAALPFDDRPPSSPPQARGHGPLEHLVRAHDRAVDGPPPGRPGALHVEPPGDGSPRPPHPAPVPGGLDDEREGKRALRELGRPVIQVHPGLVGGAVVGDRDVAGVERGREGRARTGTVDAWLAISP
jgi:hypothetical protein